jgi:hypothetical protein
MIIDNRTETISRLTERVIDKKKYPEYFKIKSTLEKLDELAKARERIALTSIFLCHPVIRNRREHKWTVNTIIDILG